MSIHIHCLYSTSRLVGPADCSKMFCYVITRSLSFGTIYSSSYYYYYYMCAPKSIHQLLIIRHSACSHVAPPFAVLHIAHTPRSLATMVPTRDAFHNYISLRNKSHHALYKHLHMSMKQG